MKQNLKLFAAWATCLAFVVGLGMLSMTWAFLGFRSDEPLHGAERVQHAIGGAVLRVFLAPLMTLPTAIAEYIAPLAWAICPLFWTVILMTIPTFAYFRKKKKEA